MKARKHLIPRGINIDNASPFFGISDATLNNRLVELQRLHSHADRHAKQLLEAISLLQREITKRARPEKRIEITDHAIVRYLERYTTCDIPGVEQEIIDMLASGRPEVAMSNGVVISVMPEGCNAMPDTTQQERQIMRESARTTFNPTTTRPVP